MQEDSSNNNKLKKAQIFSKNFSLRDKKLKPVQKPSNTDKALNKKQHLQKKEAKKKEKEKKEKELLNIRPTAR